MKLIYAAAAAAAFLTPGVAFAQTTPAQTAPASKFNLDTPIETLVADEKAKAVLAANLGMDVTGHPAYEQFKGMSLRQVQPYSEGHITDEMLKKIETDLTAIK